MSTMELVTPDVDEKAAEVEAQVAAARAQAEALQVTNDAEADVMAGLLREIKRRRSAAEAERVELTKPLLDTKKKIDARFKAAMAPFDEVDEIGRAKLGTYTAEKERIRQEEEARLRREQEEREQKAREAREAQEAEERRKREQAQKEAREAEEEVAKAKSEEDRKVAEALAEEARVAAEEAEVAEAAIAALPEVKLPTAVVPVAPKPQGVSTRKRWTVKSIDVAKLPTAYLIPDKAAINQAMRDGVKAEGAPPEIPGVVFEQVSEMAVRG